MLKTFSFPMPPSINHYYGHAVNSRTKKSIIYILPKGIWYRQQVYFLTCNKIRKINNPFYTDKLYIHIKFFPKSPLRDIDNPLKCLFDAITHSQIWKDDRQIRICLLEFNDKTSSKDYLNITICNDVSEYLDYIMLILADKKRNLTAYLPGNKNNES